MNYKSKYIKYKLKYLLLKGGDNPIFDVKFKKKPDKQILKLDFIHDLGKRNIQDKEFIDMTDLKTIMIDNTEGIEAEEYLRDKIIDYSLIKEKNKLVTNKQIDTTKLKIDLSQYTAVFDNEKKHDKSLLNINILFNINEEKDTFIRKVEKTLKIKSVIDDKEYFENNKLKTFYFIEAIKIGFDPITRDRLINFNYFDTLNILFNAIKKKYKISACNELYDIEIDLHVITPYIANIPQFITEMKNTLSILKNINTSIKNYDDISVKKDLSKYKKITKIVEIIGIFEDIFSEQKYEIDIIKDLIFCNDQITYLIFSMKAARDTYYIEEMKLMLQQQIKPIFITIDKISSYRCLLNGISTINYGSTGISFIGIIENDNFHIIGNPFDLFVKNKDDIEMIKKYDTDKTKTLIKNILNNPIISLELQRGGFMDIKDLNFTSTILNSDIYDINIITNKNFIDFMVTSSKYVKSKDDIKYIELLTNNYKLFETTFTRMFDTDDNELIKILYILFPYYIYNKKALEIITDEDDKEIVIDNRISLNTIKQLYKNNIHESKFDHDIITSLF